MWVSPKRKIKKVSTETPGQIQAEKLLFSYAKAWGILTRRACQHFAISSFVNLLDSQLPLKFPN